MVLPTPSVLVPWGCPQIRACLQRRRDASLGEGSPASWPSNPAGGREGSSGGAQGLAGGWIGGGCAHRCGVDEGEDEGEEQQQGQPQHDAAAVPPPEAVAQAAQRSLQPQERPLRPPATTPSWGHPLPPPCTLFFGGWGLNPGPYRGGCRAGYMLGSSRPFPAGRSSASLAFSSSRLSSSLP